MTTTTNGSPRVSITRETRTYDNGSPNSWFRDSWSFQRDGNEAAEKRLARAFEETRRVPPQVEVRTWPYEYEARYDSRAEEYRAPNLTAGQGQASVWPAWLIEHAATAPHVRRVASALAPSYEMPRNGLGYPFSIWVPRLAAPATPATQWPDSPVPQVDVTDAVTQSAVITLAAMYDVPMPMLEQGENQMHGADFDEWLIDELTKACDDRLERKVIAGVGLQGTSAAGGSGWDLHGQTFGPGSDLLGITQVPGVGTQSYATGPDLATFTQKLAALGGTVSNARLWHPEAWLMRFDRWMWWCSRPDTTNVRPNATPFPYVPAGVDNPVTAVGSWGGLPIHTTEGIIPSSGQDVVMCVTPSDWVIFESPIISTVFEENLSGSLEARLTVRKYAAFLGGRFPSGTGVMSGASLVSPPTF